MLAGDLVFPAIFINLFLRFHGSADYHLTVQVGMLIEMKIQSLLFFNCDKHQIQINNRDDACVSLDGDAWAQIRGPQQRRVSKSKRSKIRVWTNLSKWIYGIHICKRRSKARKGKLEKERMSLKGLFLPLSGDLGTVLV